MIAALERTDKFAGEYEAVLEICGGVIRQAYQKFGMELKEVQKEWIIIYAQKKGLEYSAIKIFNWKVTNLFLACNPGGTKTIHINVPLMRKYTCTKNMNEYDLEDLY